MPCIPPAPTSKISSSEHLWRSNIFLCHLLRREIVPTSGALLTASCIPFALAFQRYRAYHSNAPFSGCAIIDGNDMTDSRRVFTSNVPDKICKEVLCFAPEAARYV